MAFEFISMVKPCEITMIYKMSTITTPNKEELVFEINRQGGVFHFQLFSMLSARTCGAV